MANRNSSRLMILLLAAALLVPFSGRVVAQDVSCQPYYKPVNGQCVPMSPSEICPAAYSHQVGDKCVCDAGREAVNGQCVPIVECDPYFKKVDGQCVPMTEAEICPVPNTHREGEQCICNEDTKFYKGKCMALAEFCGTFAHTRVIGGDCECEEGYVEDPAAMACVPAPKAAEETNFEEAPATQVPTAAVSATEQKSEEPAAPIQPAVPTGERAVDLLDVMIDLSGDEIVDFSMEPVLEASMKDLTETEIQSVEKQKDVIVVLLGLGGEDTELPPTADQKVTQIKEVIVEKVAGKQKEWDEQLQSAEVLKRVKNKADESAYDDLLVREQGLLKSLEDNRIALEVMQKQSIQYMHNDQPFANTIWLGDKNYQEASKRDFMKETGGDPGEALVNVSQAISAQYELMGKIKEDLRSVRKQRLSLLDVPPKPSLEEELKKIKVDWYK